jgi:hypothetical protein
MFDFRRNLCRSWRFLPAIPFLLFATGTMFAPLFAQKSTIEGELQFSGATKVEKSSGVWVDGQYVGYLNELKGAKKVTLIPGEHEIVVRQAGYEDFTRKITVEPGETLALRVKMRKALDNTWPTTTAELKVDIKPSRAAVFVDNRFLGHAGELGGSFHSMLLSPGPHRIKVELPGYKTFETEVSLVAGQKSSVSTELQRGSITEAGSLIHEPNPATHEN